MIELREFIRETLSQIVAGIDEVQASESVKNSSAVIVTDGGISNASRQMHQMVEFDVAVTSQSGSEKRGGGGIFVGPVALGASGKSDQATDSTSRIRFAIPVRLPSQSIREVRSHLED